MKYLKLYHDNSLLAIKSGRQSYYPSQRVKELLEIFRCMVNDCMKTGLETDTSSLKRLSTLSYRQLKGYKCPSAYRLAAISRLQVSSPREKNRSDEATQQKRRTCPNLFSFRATDSR